MEAVDGPFEALVAARTAPEVGAAFAALVARGHCTEARAWRLDLPRGLLLGLDRSTDALPRAETPEWHAAERGLDVWVHGDRSAVCVPLRGPSGVCGAARFGFDARVAALPERIATFARLAGLALERTLATDRALRDQETLAHVLTIVDEGVMLITTDAEVLHYNDAMARLCGWTRDDVRARGWTNCVYRTDQERAEAHKAIAALVMGRPSEGTQRSMWRKDGSPFVGAVWSRMVADPSGGAPALLGVIRDATREAQERADLTREENLARLGRLARAVAHDVNNLMCAIGGHAELIASWSDDDRVRRSADLLMDATERGARLTRELLAFGGPSTVRLQPTRLADIVERAVSLFRASAPPTLALSEDIDASLVIEADAGLLHQAVLNVLTNARHACGGAGTVRISARRVPMPGDATWRSEVAPPPETLVARIRVHDDGPGFPDVPAARLFEPFFTTRQDGHGVGLAAVQGAVASHGGAIHVQNEGGARIDLFVPLSTRPETAYPELARQGSGGGRRVWILDDQVQILEFSRISLAAQGFDVRVFDGWDALRTAARATPPALRPDVLVLDLSSPEGESTALLPELRAAGVDAPVLWVSGGGSTNGLPPGAFLPKPYTGSRLAEAVFALVG